MMDNVKQKCDKLPTVITLHNKQHILDFFTSLWGGLGLPGFVVLSTCRLGLLAGVRKTRVTQGLDHQLNQSAVEPINVQSPDALKGFGKVKLILGGGFEGLSAGIGTGGGK